MSIDRSFWVYKDDGTELKVNVTRSRHGFKMLSGSSGSVKGTRTLRLEDGRILSTIEHGTYKIVETGEIVRRKH
jgi:hypothetical protein